MDQHRSTRVTVPSNMLSAEISGNGKVTIVANKEYTIAVSAISNQKYPSDPVVISKYVCTYTCAM